MDVLLNTLYVVTRGASLRRDHLTVTVWVEQQRRLAVPIHQLEGIAVFGGVHVTPGVLHLCAEHGVAVTFLSESGRLVSRVDAPGSGNVLLRREQFRWADRPDAPRRRRPAPWWPARSTTPATCCCAPPGKATTRPTRPNSSRPRSTWPASSPRWPT